MKNMKGHNEILRYMGHKGEADSQLENLIRLSLEKLEAVCEPLHVSMQFPCTVSGNCVTIDTMKIESKKLAAHLCNCTQTYILAATLGAAVDRLISQRTKIDSAEALCLQACAAEKIESYCDSIENELLSEINKHGLHLRPRFSPGYGDFNIAHQSDILRILQAHKRIGVTETKTNMLTPLKSVTAVLGVGTEAVSKTAKCAGCGKKDCPFFEKGSFND